MKERISNVKFKVMQAVMAFVDAIHPMCVRTWIPSAFKKV